VTEITIENISRRFIANNPQKSEIQAVCDVSLKIKSGGSLALLGPTGCGKTTLLRLIAGLDTPTNGEVLYDGMRLEEVPLQERGIGMVFQDYALIPHWEAEKTISFFLRLRHREREVPERVRRVSKITGVGIETLMDKLPRQMSGGEKQRVAIARAFARDLQVLLLDEPFASLDAKFRASARIELKRLLQEFPVTTIMVTHDQQEAASLVERIALMREGSIEQTGPYRHLHDHPRNIFVAQFIGVPTMNRLEGVARGGKWYGKHFGGYVIPADVHDETPITLGIRADAIHATSSGVSGKIDLIEMHFAERYTLLTVSSGDEHWQMQTELNPDYKIGDTIQCQLQPAHALYFNTHTGEYLSPFLHEDDTPPAQTMA
jgi:ABC-type sugar transport system ATPase subunit